MARQLVKVRFGLNSEDWHGHSGEFLWAAPIDGVAGQFRILNSPYFTRGINYEDIVGAAPTDDRRVFEFERIVERAGHSTYMLIVEIESQRFDAYWQKLEEKGCSYEPMEMEFSMGRRRLLSVDVPPSANIHEVYRLLEEGESVGVWMFQEGFAYLPKDT